MKGIYNMHILNKKGEAVTMTVVVLAALAAFMFGSMKNPISGFFGFGDSGQNTATKQTSKMVSEPVFITDAETGEERVLYRVSEETNFEDTMVTPKTTLWQKLMILPRLWLILMICGIFFPPVAGIMGILNRRLFGEAKKIVGGVEDALKKVETQPEVKKEILDTLSKKYDSTTKKLVSDIKRKL